MALWRRVALVVTTFLVAVACNAPGPDAEVGDGDLPGENVTGQEWVDGIPLYPQAEAVNDATREQGVVAQSFTTDRVRPKALLAWYERELARDEWEAVERAHPVGSEAYRGRWVKERRELIVSAAPGPELEELRGVERATQFSLSLDRAG